MPTKTRSRFAGVLAHHQDRVVLVRETFSGWGGAYWNIPSGRVEDDESPGDGARRELAEETGLVVAVGDLILQCTTEVTTPGGVSLAWNFTVDVDDPTLCVGDPDGLIQEARWFSAAEAARLLEGLPYRPLSEPCVAVLTGQLEPGTHWSFSDPRGEPVITRPGT